MIKFNESYRPEEKSGEPESAVQDPEVVKLQQQREVLQTELLAAQAENAVHITGEIQGEIDKLTAEIDRRTKETENAMKKMKQPKDSILN